MSLPLLAIETVGATGSIAAAIGDRLLAQRLLPADRRSAQSLAPAIAALLHDVGWQPADVRLVGVIRGPGSFTGLRVGVVTAKTYCYAVGAACVALGSLETIASQAPDSICQVEVAIDAGRNQVYAATCLRDQHGRMTASSPVEIVDDDVWLRRLAPGSIVSGPALEKLAHRLPAGVEPLAESLRIPRAATVARLAWLRFDAGFSDDPWTLAPLYVRRSAAEEKRDGPTA